jgi:polygalacturonase
VERDLGADLVPNNGENTNIIIEDCEFDFCHGALTCGSESIHNENIIMRNCKVDQAVRLLWLKMRLDTPQRYEYITIENIKGQARSFIYVKPWTLFFDLKGKAEVPLSYSDHITMRNIKLDCDIFFDVALTEYDKLSNFTFENLKIKAKNGTNDLSIIENSTRSNVRLNGKKYNN